MEIKIHRWFLICFLSKEIYGYFLGGTINLKAIGHKKVRFYERLGYKLQQGPGCDVGLEGTFVSKLTADNWKCTTGCAASDAIKDVNYYCSSAHTLENWEQGDKTFDFTFPYTGQFVVSYSGHQSGPSNNFIETTLDLSVRSDTNTPNSSPITASKPVYEMPIGCTSIINIPVIDPDNDHVLCRWAKNSECGGLCQQLPKADLDQNSCSLTIDASASNGYTVNTLYLVAVTLEDRPTTSILLDNRHYTNNTPISTVPLQFTIHIVQPLQTCADIPVFVSDTPLDGQTIIVPKTGVLNLNIFAKSMGTSSRIREFILSAPNGLTVSSPIIDEKGRLNVWYAKVSWSPKASQQGLNILCVEAVDNTGMTSQQRCFFLQADVVNFCDPNPCLNGGVCTSQSNSYTCSCSSDYFGVNCESKITPSCSNPDDSYCMCNLNGRRAKIPFPEADEEVVSARDLLSGIVGFPIGAVVGVAICSIWHHYLRKRFCSGDKRKRLGSATSSMTSSISSNVGIEDLESVASSSFVKPILGTTNKLGLKNSKPAINRKAFHRSIPRNLDY